MTYEICTTIGNSTGASTIESICVATEEQGRQTIATITEKAHTLTKAFPHLDAHEFTTALQRAIGSTARVASEKGFPLTDTLPDFDLEAYEAGGATYHQDNWDVDATTKGTAIWIDLIDETANKAIYNELLYSLGGSTEKTMHRRGQVDKRLVTVDVNYSTLVTGRVTLTCYPMVSVEPLGEECGSDVMCERFSEPNFEECIGVLSFPHAAVEEDMYEIPREWVDTGVIPAGADCAGFGIEEQILMVARLGFESLDGE